MEPDFPCLADEIADPRPDMNIKVAAFTVSEKSSNTYCHTGFFLIMNVYFVRGTPQLIEPLKSD